MKKKRTEDEMEFVDHFDDDGEETPSQDSFDMERKKEEMEYDVDNEHVK